MSAYPELLQRVHQPMREWWRTTGAWLLAAMIAFWLLLEVLILPHGTDPTGIHPATLFVALIAGLGLFLSTTVIWLLAALYLLRILKMYPARKPSTDTLSRHNQAVFLIIAQQGLCPLLLFWLLRMSGGIIAQRLNHPASQWSLNWLDHAANGWFAVIDFIPVMLVVLSLLVITRRFALSVILIVLQSLSQLAWKLLLRGEQEAWDPWSWWIWGLQIAISAAVIYSLVSGVLKNRDKIWRSAYGLLAGGLVLAPLLYSAFVKYSGWPLWVLARLADGPAFLLFNNAGVGDWLYEGFDIWFTPEQTLLWHAAPSIPYLWTLASCGGLLAWLYWLLGCPWRKRESSPPGAAASPILG